MTERVLARLSRVSPTAAFVGVTAFVFIALLVPDAVGGVLLLALAAGLAWLLVRTWPVQTPRARVPRLVVLAGLVVVAVIRLTG